jgi:hypothetical protein
MLSDPVILPSYARAQSHCTITMTPLSLAVRRVLLAIKGNPAFRILLRVLLYVYRLLRTCWKCRGSSQSIFPTCDSSTQAVFPDQCVPDYRPPRNVICASALPQQVQIPISSGSESRDVAAPGGTQGYETGDNSGSAVFDGQANPGGHLSSLTPVSEVDGTDAVEPCTSPIEMTPVGESPARVRGELKPILPSMIDRYGQRPTMCVP